MLQTLFPFALFTNTPETPLAETPLPTAIKSVKPSVACAVWDFLSKNRSKKQWLALGGTVDGAGITMGMMSSSVEVGIVRSAALPVAANLDEGVMSADTEAAKAALAADPELAAEEDAAPTKMQVIFAHAMTFHENCNLETKEATRLVAQSYKAILAALLPFIHRKAWQLGSTTSDAKSNAEILVSTAMAAVYQNLRRWDPVRHRNFSLTAMRIHLQSEMVQCLNREIRMVRIPEQLVQHIIAFHKASTRGEGAAFLAEARKVWTPRRVADVETYKHALNAGYATEQLVEQHEESEDGAPRCSYTIQAAPEPESPTPCSDEVSMMLKAIGALCPTERRAVSMHFGMGDYSTKHTFAEIGIAEGITREGARQRVLVGLQKLRKKMAYMFQVFDFADLRA